MRSGIRDRRGVSPQYITSLQGLTIEPISILRKQDLVLFIDYDLRNLKFPLKIPVKNVFTGTCLNFFNKLILYLLNSIASID